MMLVRWLFERIFGRVAADPARRAHSKALYAKYKAACRG